MRNKFILYTSKLTYCTTNKWHILSAYYIRKARLYRNLINNIVIFEE